MAQQTFYQLSISKNQEQASEKIRNTFVDVLGFEMLREKSSRDFLSFRIVLSRGMVAEAKITQSDDDKTTVLLMLQFSGLMVGPVNRSKTQDKFTGYLNTLCDMLNIYSSDMNIIKPSPEDIKNFSTIDIEPLIEKESTIFRYLAYLIGVLAIGCGAFVLYALLVIKPAKEERMAQKALIAAQQEEAKRQQEEVDRLAKEQKEIQERMAEAKKWAAKWGVSPAAYLKGEKAVGKAAITCQNLAKAQARYDHDSSFFSVSYKSWHMISENQLFLVGDNLKLQNGFGAWQQVEYKCQHTLPANKNRLGNTILLSVE